MNFSGKYNYLLMYLNNIEYIYNINLPSAFAKIQLNGNIGDILFNTFVQTNACYSPTFPIATLTDLSISYLYPDGSVPDFRNITHSFTLKIVEEIYQSHDIRLNSQHSTFEDKLRENSI